MSFRSYLFSRAAGLCLCGAGAIVWRIFAFFAGANPVLLWGGELFFAAFAGVWLAAGYFAAYFLKGLLLTIGLVCVVFVLSSLTSALYLKRVSVYTLLHDDKKVEEK